MPRQQMRLLPDGKRLHLQDGPIDLVIGAEGTWEAVTAAYQAARARFATLLDELCAELPLLRQEAGQEPTGETARQMLLATRPFAALDFITPMAAVAGAGADTILAAMLRAAPLTRAYVNNGGDIALHLAPGQSFAIGMMVRPELSTILDGQIVIQAEDGIHGIATSGRHGRSFSLGIADAVTVLADSAAEADAAATMIANRVDLPGHPAITRAQAISIQPDSDLGERLVTRAVAALSQDEIEEALDHGARHAGLLVESGLIRAAALRLAGSTRLVGLSGPVAGIARAPTTQTNKANKTNKEWRSHAAG
ncbi:hypothetical protein A8950_3194 [Dongia mobilis]|uniref:Uncharacterized protein n=1 Tax=Dongia mobilis TaxID=578943 RepID=A0A4R6WNB5_9PROT|nr:UPF0280 family protein [Dongia mobilis]TDQ80659.1 hypothetical protein A8950_3194 [Dongia mobilis]